jgi:hypothetical protein
MAYVYYVYSMSFDSIYDVINIVRDANQDVTKRLDAYRHKLEPYIFNYLIEHYGPRFQKFWETYLPPKKAERAFIIVERRDHPNFKFVLQNIAWSNPNMSVYIFCSDINYSFILSLLGDKAPFFNITQIFKGNPPRFEAVSEYNRTLKDYRFYEQIDAKYGITVQMDTIFRKKIPDHIFVGDYWGNPWAWKQSSPGGGGATIRNISSLKFLCRLYNPMPETDMNSDAEDSWISDHMTLLSMSYPDIEFRKNHIMESMPAEDPVILHQFWTFSDQYLSMPQKELINYWKRLLTIKYD